MRPHLRCLTDFQGGMLNKHLESWKITINLGNFETAGLDIITTINRFCFSKRVSRETRNCKPSFVVHA